ncbi:MAG: NAD(P)-binding domain-containing protein [bacterium]|nr:NAD(P)-binding domain-containing protein [bacterium]
MSSPNNRPLLGLIGAGTMGGGMARNLLQAGYALTVFDLQQENINALVEGGASAGASARDVVQKSDITLTSLPTSGTFVKVAEEILPDLKDGKILIDAGTTEVPETRRLAQQIRAQGADLVDAPVSGGGRGADAGTLAVMVGGAPETVAQCRPILDTIGNNIGHLGDVGAGQLGKAVNQIAMGVAQAAFLEAAFIGVQDGLDPQALWDTLSTAGRPTPLLNRPSNKSSTTGQPLKTANSASCPTLLPRPKPPTSTCRSPKPSTISRPRARTAHRTPLAFPHPASGMS